MEIAEVTDVDLAFPANGWKMLPDRKLVERFVEDEPEAYRKWESVFADLFYRKRDATKLQLYPKEGTPSEKVWRMICCIMGTYGCKHEHKVEGLAYTFNYFFTDYKWDDEDTKPS